jgi:hypothetical protein
MKTSKSDLIAEYFSPYPVYRRRMWLGNLAATVTLLLVFVSLILQFAGTLLFGEGFKASDGLLLALLVVTGIFAALALSLLVRPLILERQARLFIRERMTDRFATIVEDACRAAQLADDEDVEVIVLSGYTASDLAGRKARFYRDDVSGIHSTHYESTVLLFLGEDLFCYTVQTSLDLAESRLTHTERIPCASMREVRRVTRNFSWVGRKGKDCEGSYEYLLIEHDAGVLETSLTHFDSLESSSDKHYSGIEALILSRVAQAIEGGV